MPGQLTNRTKQQVDTNTTASHLGLWRTKVAETEEAKIKAAATQHFKLNSELEDSQDYANNTSLEMASVKVYWFNLAPVRPTGKGTRSVLGEQNREPTFSE